MTGYFRRLLRRAGKPPDRAPVRPAVSSDAGEARPAAGSDLGFDALDGAAAAPEAAAPPAEPARGTGAGNEAGWSAAPGPAAAAPGPWPDARTERPGTEAVADGRVPRDSPPAPLAGFPAEPARPSPFDPESNAPVGRARPRSEGATARAGDTRPGAADAAPAAPRRFEAEPGPARRHRLAPPVPNAQAPAPADRPAAASQRPVEPARAAGGAGENFAGERPDRHRPSPSAGGGGSGVAAAAGGPPLVESSPSSRRLPAAASGDGYRVLSAGGLGGRLQDQQTRDQKPMAPADANGVRVRIGKIAMEIHQHGAAPPPAPAARRTAPKVATVDLSPSRFYLKGY